MNDLQNFDTLYNDIVTFFKNSFLTKMIIREKEMEKLKTLSEKLNKLKERNNKLENNNNKMKEKINSIKLEITEIKDNIYNLILNNTNLNNIS